MNADERQALRDKHREVVDEYGSYCDYCEGSDGYEQDKIEMERSVRVSENGEPLLFAYPCDTIKVLDAYEHDVWLETERAFGRGHAKGFDKAWALSGQEPLVSKVFDILQGEPELVSETDPECDHITRNICLCDYSGDGCSLDEEPDFAYCPKCGEKL